jgi:hypothetical protein
MPEFESFSIPEKCIGCPKQHALATALQALEIAKDLMQETGINLIDETPEGLNAEIGELLPEEVAASALENLRKYLAGGLDSIDEAVTGAEASSQALALSCSGVLKMRASKGDFTYTVNICTSPSEYYINDYRQSSARIRVDNRTPPPQD